MKPTERIKNSFFSESFHKKTLLLFIYFLFKNISLTKFYLFLIQELLRVFSKNCENKSRFLFIPNKVLRMHFCPKIFDAFLYLFQIQSMHESFYEDNLSRNSFKMKIPNVDFHILLRST